MKTCYSIYYSKKGNNDSYILYKEYEYDTRYEIGTDDLSYRCNNLSELKIYLNLIGLKWKDFKQVKYTKYDTTLEITTYRTEYIDIKDN